MCCTRLAENTAHKKSPKSCDLGTILQLCQAISSQLRHVSTIGKNLLSSNISSTYPRNMVSFSPLAAEIVSLVWGTPANFNSFHVFVSLLHGTLVVGISQTLWRWTEGATYIRQGGHHVGHWPTFLVSFLSPPVLILTATQLYQGCWQGSIVKKLCRLGRQITVKWNQVFIRCKWISDT